MESSKQNQLSTTDEKDSVIVLYRTLLDAWNERNAERMAAQFTEDGFIVGFDGSQMSGRSQIASEIGRIFSSHPTATYYGKVRGVRFLSPEIAILDAVTGMVSPGQIDLNPAVNTIQALVAVKQGGRWYITHYQNTPAQFHGRPDLAQQLTEELQKLL